MAPRRPEVFVASEFFAREPQRRAWEAMRRDHAEYEELFGPPPEERAEPQLERAAEIIAAAPWFAESFAALRSESTSKAEQAMDLARAMRLVTYEPVAEPPNLCTKGEPVPAFMVIVRGSVAATDDPLVMHPSSGSRTMKGGQWFGTEALTPPDPFNAGVANAATSNIRPTGERLVLLQLLRTDHLRTLAVQSQREHRLYADVLARVPMLKHYSCRQRTALAATFNHAKFIDGETVVEDASRSKAFFVLLRGCVKVRKTLHVGVGLSYPIDLKVLHEGDIFGGDRFSSGLAVFRDLSFIAQGAIECLALSSDHRLLDGRARELILQEFQALPDEGVLLRAYDEQSDWEREKSGVIRHQFKAAVSMRKGRSSSASRTDFARAMSRDTFTRTSVYIPTGEIQRQGQYRPAISWRHGREGRHMAETPSQFAQRQALVGSTKREWEERLSQCPGSRSAIRSRRVSTVPLAMSSAEIYAMAAAERGASAPDVSRGRSAEAKRPPRPITPNDFGPGWLNASALPGDGGGMAMDGLSGVEPGSRNVVTPDSLAGSSDLGMGFADSDASGLDLAVNPMWPEQRPSSRASHASWGVRAIATDSSASMMTQAEKSRARELPGPEVSDGFDRMLLQRLVETNVQTAMISKQTRSTRHCPELSVLVADVVDVSGLRDCGPELTAVLDDIFTKFKDLAEGYFGAEALWGTGRRFIALSGVRRETESDDAAEEPDAMKAATWRERSFEAAASYLEGEFERADAAKERERTLDSREVGNEAVERLVQLAKAMQRCVAHANASPEARKWGLGTPLCLRVGIATGPAVVGFFGVGQPFCYNAWGWTVDEARRLEGNAPAGGILLEASAHEAVAGSGYDFDAMKAHGAIRGGDGPRPEYDYSLVGGGAKKKSASRPSVTAPKRREEQPKAVSDAKVPTDVAGKENRAGSRGRLSLRPGMRTKAAGRAVPLREQLRNGRASISRQRSRASSVGLSANSNSSVELRHRGGVWVEPVSSEASLRSFAEGCYHKVATDMSSAGPALDPAPYPTELLRSQ